MTDNEIIKALECCTIDGGEGCKRCSMCNISSCFEILSSNALALINRQQAELNNYSHNIKNLTTSTMRLQAEIERLKAENEKAKTYLANCFDKYEKTKIAKDSLENTLYTARAEAIKEFAERLKNSLKGYGGLYCQTTMNVKIDNLVKEMVGK